MSSLDVEVEDYPRFGANYYIIPSENQQYIGVVLRLKILESVIFIQRSPIWLTKSVY